jgi:hypothetical protein
LFGFQVSFLFFLMYVCPSCPTSFESEENNIEANKNNYKSFPTSHASEHQWGKPGPAGIGGAFMFYFSCTAGFIDSSEAELLAIYKAQA